MLSPQQGSQVLRKQRIMVGKDRPLQRGTQLAVAAQPQLLILSGVKGAFREEVTFALVG